METKRNENSKYDAVGRLITPEGDATVGRRLFAERGYELSGRVLPPEEFTVCRDVGGFVINPEHRAGIIKKAEEALAEEIPQLLATEYMLYSRNGNRSIFQERYFARRRLMLALALGEYVEGEGRFTDKLVDLVWLILEETSWVLPAHNPSRPGVKCPLPYAYSGEVDYIDLFSATTAADLATVYYLVGDRLDGVTELINERLLAELDRRIIKPYLNDEYMLRGRNWWTGAGKRKVNNWNPWIISNILTVTALTVTDMPTRVKLTERSLDFLDNFTALYHPDGGCDEGPSYWGAAGGALFICLTILYDLTGGYINLYSDPLIRNMGEYITKVIINGTRVLNFADSPARLTPSPALVYQWGRAVGSEPMLSYAADRLGGRLPDPVIDDFHPYRSMRNLTAERLPVSRFSPTLTSFIGGVDVAITREPEGLYLAMKGGNNNESHNHNDLGNLIVFSGDTPIFIDAGSGTYTKKTFSSDRYKIWAMCSDYHNCATLNGFTQPSGPSARAELLSYDASCGAMTLELGGAYPEEAGIVSYTRCASLENSVIKIVDDVEFRDTGTVKFHFLTPKDPEEVGESHLVIGGRRVEFDPSLELAVELLDASEPETERLPHVWDTDALRRITLSTKTPVKSARFVLTVR